MYSSSHWARTDWLRVRVMWLTGISGHGADGLVGQPCPLWDITMLSQWDSIIMSPWVQTFTSQYPSWYDLKCCHDLKLQQPTNIPVGSESAMLAGRTLVVGTSGPANGGPHWFKASTWISRRQVTPPAPPHVKALLGALSPSRWKLSITTSAAHMGTHIPSLTASLYTPYPMTDWGDHLLPDWVKPKTYEFDTRC